jgi:hypothetical protein
MSVRHLLSAADLSRDEATAILDDADRFRQALLGREVKKLPTLRGRTVITMFYENSTRTRVSFEVAGKWMSADVINVSASGSSVAKGESLRDTALTLRAAGADALIIRHPASGAAQLLAVHEQIAEAFARSHELGGDNEHEAEAETGAQGGDPGRQDRWQRHAPDHLEAREPEDAPDLDDLAIHARQRRCHAEIDGEEHAHRDQRHL